MVNRPRPAQKATAKGTVTTFRPGDEISLVESTTTIKRRSNGQGRKESENTGHLRNFLKTAAETRKTYDIPSKLVPRMYVDWNKSWTDANYKDAKLTPGAATVKQTLHRLAKDFDVSVVTGVNDWGGIAFACVDRIQRKPRADKGQTRKATAAA